MDDGSSYLNTIVPSICKGIYGKKLDKTETHEVYIYNSPIGEFSGPVYCTLIYPPGFRTNYKKNDRISVLIPFTFRNGKFDGVSPGSAKYILGKFEDRSIANLRVEHPVTKGDNDSISFVNEKSGAGLVASETGQLSISTGGAVYSIMKAGGYGTEENQHTDYAQNFSRIISYNSPYYLSREHFGMFTGKDQSDQASNISPDQIYINYRRFVTQTQGPDNWVSTCEGAWSPWVGANNGFNEVNKRSEVLFSKVINHDDTRLTIEAGDPGKEFFKLRVDNIISGERQIQLGPGATPATVGNKFKLTISDDGELDLRAGGDGTPQAPKDALQIKIDKDGNLKIYAKNIITISHSEADESNNSIVLDPKKGIDVTAKKGFRVNEQPVVVKKFIDWMNKNKDKLCQVTSIGGPAPIHPLALPEFSLGVSQPESSSGFLSVEQGPNSQGLIIDSDQHSSV